VTDFFIRSSDAKRKGVRTILRIAGILVMVLLVILLMALAVSLAFHTSQLRKEAVRYPPPGVVTDANGTGIHVYTGGEGGKALVFLSGQGTVSPVWDFSPLWKRLAGDHRFAVVERPGYGWSSPSRSSRDVDTMLEESRSALESAGLTGPYVLVAHSMAGLEALNWARKYPREVEAIVGLDPCTPESAESLPEPDRIQLNVMRLICRTGLTRLIPEDETGTYLPLLQQDGLTQEEKESYMAVFYASAYSSDMLREAYALRENARLVGVGGVPEDTPMLFFISSQQEPAWQEALADYVAGVKNGKTLTLETGHYVHHEMAEQIAGEIQRFLAVTD